VLIFSIDKKTNLKCQIKLKVLPILDNKPYSIIIGRPDIINYNLLDKFANQWSSETNIATEGGAEKFHGHVTAHSETNPHHVAVLSSITPSGDMSMHTPSLGTHRYDEDEDVIPYEHWDDAWQKNDSDVTNDITDIIMHNVQSDNTEFKIRTKRFLERWKEVFSRTLSSEPAQLAPLEITVDAEKWETRRSQGPPRIMSFEKEQHLRKFIEESVANNIIRPSTASHYSQVHLVPKPPSPDGTKKMRTTIDYRYLNECSKPMSWPLPNISQMIQAKLNLSFSLNST
jgi:hypothetical protein